MQRVDGQRIAKPLHGILCITAGHVHGESLGTQRTQRVIRQNLAWALAYNVVALPMAAAGLVTPWLAALGMALSSLIVTVNALRLTRPPRGSLPA